MSMSTESIFINFIAAYLSCAFPPLKEEGSKETELLLDNYIDGCYLKALKKWYENSSVRERLAIRKFPNVNKLRELIVSDEWSHFNQVLKSLVKIWAKELQNDEECSALILNQDLPEIDNNTKGLLDLLSKHNPSDPIKFIGRGRIEHEQVEGYIRRYCSSDLSESNYVFYTNDASDRHVLADYVVGIEGHTNNKFVLYSSAQTGKTTELKQLCWELQQSGLYFPVSFEVRTNTKLKRTDLPVYKSIGDKEVIVVIDALDEVNGKVYDDLLEEIGGYAYDHPEITMVLSSRSNYRREKQLDLFNELFLTELGGKEAQAHIFEKMGKTKGKRLVRLIIDNQLDEFAKNPFFLNVLIDAYKENSKHVPTTKADIYKLFIEKSYKNEKERKNLPIAVNHSFDESVLLLERVALGMSLMNVQSLSKCELLQCLYNNENNLEECLRYDLIRLEDEGIYSFKHNAFREWLVAHYLGREGLTKAKQFATHPNGRIKPEWYNIIMLWVSMYGKDKKEEIAAILDWLKGASLDLVIYIDKDMLDDTTRNNVFKGLLLEYKSLGIRMSNIMSRDYKNLLSFGQSDETIGFLVEEISDVKIRTAYYADLMCLCYYLDWGTWLLRNADLTERLFLALIQKTKKELAKDNSQDLSFLYFDNEFFTKKDYFERIFTIIKESNNYQAIKAMIRLIDVANKVDDYVDYILDKEKYIHNQQEGTTTLIVTRTCIYGALSKINTSVGIKKVLGHQFYNSHSSYSEEQDGYLNMLSSILNHISGFIIRGDKELVGLLENYFVKLYKDYHYYFVHDQQSQGLLYSFRKCYLDAGLADRGRKIFYEKLSVLFKPHKGNEVKWEAIRTTFVMAALWITENDVKEDFERFTISDSIDWAKASWYREIPYKEVGEYATHLYNEKYPQPAYIIKGRERRQKSFDNFADYVVFKQIVLEMVSGLNEHTTRREYGKKLRELEDGYNQYAFRFFLCYPKHEDRYDIKAIIKGIKDKEVYESFFMKEVVELMDYSNPELPITEDIRNRCKYNAKASVIKLCEGRHPVYFIKEAIGLMLKGYFEIPVEQLLNLIDYGNISISKKDEDGYFNREYSLFDYIRERVDVEVLSPVIIEKLRNNIDKNNYCLSYQFANYLVENGVENGYDLALRFALSGFYMAANILDLLIKNGIKIDEIIAASVGMQNSDRIFCYTLLARYAEKNVWVKNQLEKEFLSFEGCDFKLAIQQLLSMGSMVALDYLILHLDAIKQYDDYHFNYDNSNAVPSLCFIIEYYTEHKLNGHFMLNSILASLERIATKSQDSLYEVKKYLQLLIQKGEHYKYLNRYSIAFEDKYYASFTGISDIKEAMKQMDGTNFVGNNEVSDTETNTSSEEDEIYISYNWESASMNTVEYLCFVLESQKIPYKRDKKDCDYLENLKGFMNTIRAGKTVIVVFSRPYLKSKSCMYELSGIMEDSSYFERILPVVVDDDIRERVFYVDLVKYWKAEKESQADCVSQLKAIDPILAKPEEEKLKEIEAVYNLLPQIKKYIDWTNTENLNDMCATRFGSIVRKIREKMIK